MADQTEVERQFEAWFANHGYKFGLPKFEMLPVFFAGNEAGYEAGARDMRERAAKEVECECIEAPCDCNTGDLAAAVRSLPLTEDGE